MKVLYVYPIVFTWDRIVPAEYPFIGVRGPAGTEGVLMVFDDRDKYESFAKLNSEKYHPALLIQQPEKEDQDGKQNERDGKSENESKVFGGRGREWNEAGSRGQAGTDQPKPDGVAGRGNNDARVSNVGPKRGHRNRR